jgi:hypothetical protein
MAEFPNDKTSRFSGLRERLKSALAGPISGSGSLFNTVHGFGRSDKNYDVFVLDTIFWHGGFFHGPGAHNIVK